MFQINHEAFITKINYRKHLHVELKLLQTGSCTMGGPLSVIFSNIYMTKTEEVVKPTNPSFYERFLDDIITKKQKDQLDCLRI